MDFKIKYLFFYVLLLLNIISCKNNYEDVNLNTSLYGFTDTIGVNLHNYYEVDSLYSFFNFDLDTVRFHGIVSPIMIQNLTKSISKLDVSTRKDVFIKMMLVHSLVANKSVSLERDSILNLMELDSLTNENELWLATKKKKYRVKSDGYNELLTKVDVIPPSLIIAQAITETGWGTSYFASEGNCLFGEHTYSNNPSEYIKAKNSNIKMKKFKTLQASTQGYLLNLNRNNAYKSLRNKRNQLNILDKNVDGYSLLKTLVHYSELGDEYINRVYGLMKYNHLLVFDNISIIEDVPLILVIIED